jgi:hypothetical protein
VPRIQFADAGFFIDRRMRERQQGVVKPGFS